MGIPLAVLIVEDTESDAQLIVRLLKKAGYEINFEQVETAEQMRAALEKKVWDVVISDYRLPQFSGQAALILLQETGLDIPFIVVSGTIGEETAVAMMKAGAHDYLMKGNLARLAPAIERELIHSEVRRKRAQADKGLRHNRDLLLSLSRAAQTVQRADTPDQIYRAVGDEIKTLGYGLTIFTLCDDREHLTIAHTTIAADLLRAAEKLTRLPAQNYRLPIPPESIFGQIVAGEGAMFLHSTRDATVQVLPKVLGPLTSRLMTLLKVEQGIVAPLRTEGTTLGVLAVTGSALDEGDVPAMDTFAAQVAISLRNARLTQQVLAELAERKRAEETLRESEGLLRSLFENMTCGAAIYKVINDGSKGSDYIIKDFNAASLRIEGKRKDEVIGKSLFDLRPTIDQFGLIPVFQKVWRTGETGYFPSTVYIDEKYSNWYENRVFKLPTDEIVAIYDDVTERKQAEEEIHRMALMLDTAPNSITVHDFDGRFLYANQKTFDLHGFTRDEFLALNLRQLDVPDSKNLIAPRMQELLDRGEATFESAHYRKDSSTVPLEITARVTTWGDKKVILSIATDITERKRAEQEIATLARFPAENPNPILRVEPTGVILYANAASEPVLAEWNCKVGDALPLEWRQLIADSAASQSKRMRDVQCGEKAFSFWVAPISAAGYVNLYGRDITERKQAEEQVGRMALMLDTAPNSITVHDFDGRYLYANQKTFDLHGFTRDEFLQLNLHQLDVPESENQIAPRMQELLDRGAATFESTHYRKDGSTLPLEVSARVATWGERKVILSVATDITERKRAEERIQHQFEHLGALRLVDQAISASFELRITFDILLEQVATQLQVDATSILLLDPHRQVLEYTSGRGFRTDAFKSAKLRLGEGYAGRAALERCLIHIPNLADQDDNPRLAKHLASEGFTTYYGLPLIAKGKVKGVLEIFHRAPINPDEEWLDFLQTLAGQAAIAIDDTQLFQGLQRSNMDLIMAYDATLEGWSRALDLRDKETEGHSARVTEMTMRLAQMMGLSDKELLHIHRGALLHDIGKMGVPDHILLKPDKLTDEEWVTMRKHPTFAYELLLPIAYLRPALDIPYCHHEKWDGTGYPRGLKGEQIPLAARLFAIVDVWDALRSDRPYRQGWPKEKVIKHIKSLSGIHFDPKAVDLFLNMLVELSKDQAE